MRTGIDDIEETAAVWNPSFGLIFAAAVVVLNLFALGIAASDRSWVAFGVAIVWGPLMNFLLALGALIAIPSLQGKSGFSLANHLTLAIGLPAGAAVVDLLAIFSMNLHGC